MVFPACSLKNVSSGENVESLQGRDELSSLFLPSFSLSFSLFFIAGVTTMWMGVDFQRLELEFSFREWRAGTVGGIWNQLSAPPA